MSIKENAYNQARSILAQAGSKSAAKSHASHAGGTALPDDYGKALLQEARDEFRTTDAGQPNLQSGMTQPHYDAIQQAAQAMGITNW